ncbi:MAG: flagellar hook-basal body complex protein FliE [Candidatus Kapabacteria bacterium]|nr:flagellar hook-basal body complex protein FliE [Candidatus Kapabacteria bacterium]MDW7997549.1 flagellar hook-basal body complex protein FliE [Bacteroidota bacterium]MDW8225283.1 flagellar hook-basal body complex protein FliE [Bacteroidota bacterium]
MVVPEALQNRLYSPLQQQALQAAAPIGSSFVDTLRAFITEVNTLQTEAAEYTERLMKGEPVELHDVMIAAEKARTSFQLLLELRNKALELYREVLRIQV